MDFQNTQVMNFKNAIRGMRNPKNSWGRSDSYFGVVNLIDDMDADFQVADEWIRKIGDSLINQGTKEYESYLEEIDDWLLNNGILQRDSLEETAEVAFIGPADMQLAENLIKAGPEHRKFLRQIFVSVDITAPIYFWKEASTYKVGTTANSTSTMHTLTAKPITIDCFEIGDYNPNLKFEDHGIDEGDGYPDALISTVGDNVNEEIINFLENLRRAYIRTKDTRYWKELVRWLPQSWLQTRTWTGSYENLYSMAHQRATHKLTEWSNDFMQWVGKLPYAKEFILQGLPRSIIEPITYSTPDIISY